MAHCVRPTTVHVDLNGHRIKTYIMEKTSEQLMIEIAIITERIRIMSEIDLKKLPTGAWDVIKDVIMPPKKHD
jgi:hypothetical protein